MVITAVVILIGVTHGYYGLRGPIVILILLLVVIFLLLISVVTVVMRLSVVVGGIVELWCYQYYHYGYW